MQVITNKHLHTDTVAPWLGPGEADGAADSTRGPGTYTGSGGGDTAGQSPPPLPEVLRGEMGRMVIWTTPTVSMTTTSYIKNTSMARTLQYFETGRTSHTEK